MHNDMTSLSASENKSDSTTLPVIVFESTNTTFANQTMSPQEQKERDLVSLLSPQQRAELSILVSAAMQRMRKSIEDTFDSPPTKASDANKQPPPVDEEILNTDKPIETASVQEKTRIPTPRLEELRKNTLASFDIWREAVTQRIKEAVNPDAGIENEVQNIVDSTHPTDDTTAKVPTLYLPIPTPLTSSLPHDYPPMVINAILLLALSLECYDARSRVLLLLISSSLGVPFSNLIEQESHTAGALVKAALMSADEESKKRSDKHKVSKWWKVGLASAAGAAIIGVTGGLAAPLVAAGLGSVMGGVGLGGTVAAGYLGAVASSSAVVGALFGAYGGKMTGEMMERYAAAVKDFAFIPVKDGKERLRVTVGISGWLTAPEEVVLPWNCLNDNADIYALRWVSLFSPIYLENFVLTFCCIGNGCSPRPRFLAPNNPPILRLGLRQI